nr:hypothetical protein [Streptomyces sp. SID5468]
MAALETWLRSEDELKQSVKREERTPQEAMGIAYDLLVQIGGEAVFATAMVLLRSIRNFRGNRHSQRGGDGFTVTLRLPERDLELVLRSGDDLTTRDLEEYGRRIERALTGGDGDGRGEDPPRSGTTRPARPTE